ncbi:hypothetical protein O181_002595 [Austropuccinia psidii MF-1]|uniref:Uncharacterized protein n=1 Tax=Austropuccinia psidii MF-1 TaxID=1389203 RepID=A0A9Q3GD06_9BASI|nr:hypothetical protein [Austropuccinia psidii MF-1]
MMREVSDLGAATVQGAPISANQRRSRATGLVNLRLWPGQELRYRRMARANLDSSHSHVAGALWHRQSKLNWPSKLPRYSVRLSFEFPARDSCFTPRTNASSFPSACGFDFPSSAIETFPLIATSAGLAVKLPC